MSTVPWRVAAQAYTVLNPETKEPLMTLQFVTDHQQADVSKLRITPAGEGNEGAPAIELEFATGGYPSGPAYLQPRWLKAFERPSATNADQRVSLEQRRKNWLEAHDGVDEDHVDGSFAYREPSDEDRAAWEEAHGPEKDKDGNPVKKKPNVGPDGVADGEERPGPNEAVVKAADEGKPAPEQPKDAFVPDAAQGRQSGVESREPSDSDRKGMIGMGPGSEVTSKGATQQAYNPSPGITPAPNEGAGPMTGGPGPQAGTVPPGGPYASDVPTKEPESGNEEDAGNTTSTKGVDRPKSKK
jgi:hypothetical protein